MPAKRRKTDHKNVVASPPDTKITCSNAYGMLSDCESEIDSELPRNVRNAVVKKEKVPPIVVTVSDFKAFRTELSSFVSNVKLSFQIGRRGECRILAETLLGHKSLLEYLTKKLYKFYTYDTKTERPFKVVLKGLTNDQSLDEIKHDLKELLGFAPSQVILMKKRSVDNNRQHSGISQENYLIHFNRNEINNLKILEKARVLFHVRVKWEHFRKHGGNVQNLTQCRKCQGWGHGTKNCNMDAKCMICGDPSHDKDNCPMKEATVNFKCANCGGNHKSNFWECPIRQKILKARTQQRQLKSEKRPSISVNLPAISRVANNVPTNNVRSYASVAASTRIPFLPTTNTPIGTQSDNPKKPDLHKFLTDDLGAVTPEKLQFLQQSMMELMMAMLNTTSMFEAFQTGWEFANKIVMTLKFNNV